MGLPLIVGISGASGAIYGVRLLEVLRASQIPAHLIVTKSAVQTLNLEMDCVSVKFKTAEKVGPVGEGRSAEAQAVVTIAR